MTFLDANGLIFEDLFHLKLEGQTAQHNLHGPIRHWNCHDTIPLLIVKKKFEGSCVLLVTHRWFLYLVFVFLLGAICTREALRYDFLIAEKVNLSLCVSILPCLKGPSERKGATRGDSPSCVLVWILTVWHQCLFDTQGPLKFKCT